MKWENTYFFVVFNFMFQIDGEIGGFLKWIVKKNITQSLSQNLATRLIVNHCKALSDGSPDERCRIVQYDRMGTILQRNSKTDTNSCSVAFSLEVKLVFVFVLVFLCVCAIAFAFAHMLCDALYSVQSLIDSDANSCLVALSLKVRSRTFNELS